MNNNEEEIKKGIENEVNTKRQNYLLSMAVMSYIEKLFLNDSGLVSLLFGNIKYDPSKEYKISIVTSGINMFFIKELIIPPNRFRPEMHISEEKKIIIIIKQVLIEKYYH